MNAITSAVRVERIGNATLYLGDCREILPTLGSVNAVITDPPYGIGQTSWDHTLPIEWFRHIPMLVGPTGAAYVFGDAITLSRFQVYWEGESITWKARIAWCYEDGPRNVAAWTSKHEDCLYYAGIRHKLQPPKEPSIHRDPRWGDDRLVGDVWRVARVLGNYDERSEHPTQKPVALIELPVSASTKDGGTVLDPFMGSGTTGVACARLGRSFVGIEINARYFDIACQRIADANRQADLFVAPVREDPSFMRTADLFTLESNQ